jgi:hypothetical protein
LPLSLVEQELLTLPNHLSSPPVCNGVRVTRYLVLCVCFVDRCLSNVYLNSRPTPMMATAFFAFGRVS